MGAIYIECLNESYQTLLRNLIVFDNTLFDNYTQPFYLF